MERHIVRQGEYFTALAARSGSEAEALWNDPANEEIRSLRRNMDQLQPGDVVYLPRHEPSSNALSVGATNSFQTHVTTVSLSVRLDDGPGQDNLFANASYRIEPLGEQEHTTDGEGTAELSVPTYLREVTLVFPAIERSVRVAVGHMDPIEEDSGIDARLEHLGYLYGTSEQHLSRQEGEERRQHALEAFQRDQGIEVTGAADDATRDALLLAHGS